MEQLLVFENAEPLSVWISLKVAGLKAMSLS